MYFNTPLLISQSLLAAIGTQMFVYHEDRIPRSGAVLVVSNHRSFLDAPLLMASIGRNIHFACHHYMGQVPILREMIEQLGCFPLDEPGVRQKQFFGQAVQLLQRKQVVGIFPEGAFPMVNFTKPDDMGKFHKGFAHLALRATVPDLTVLPIAIASMEESINSAVPLKLLSLFDPSEPLFDRSGWHPLVLYRRVNISIGRPYWIGESQRKSYRGKQAKATVGDIMYHCQTEIASLLERGSY